MTRYSYNDFHLGDNLQHLHFLRKMALANPADEFVHGVHLCHMGQLFEAVEDVKNIHLVDVEKFRVGNWPMRDVARNVWKNADGFWERHPLRDDYAGFYIQWFEHLAGEMHLESPIKKREDLLFDYPRIRVRTPLSHWFDVLLINSQPCSGQFRAYDRLDYFDPLIAELHRAGKRLVVTQKSELTEKIGIPCTRDHGLSITGVGNLSFHCSTIIMVSTGPSWPTFNTWNEASGKLRIVCLDREVLNLSSNTVQVNDLQGALQMMRERVLDAEPLNPNRRDTCSTLQP